MHYEYKTKGTCSSRILFDIEDGKLKNVEYIGGCNGNLQGIGRLVEGMPVDEVIARLRGIRCGTLRWNDTRGQRARRNVSASRRRLPRR